ncbi:MAG: hypothetical protein F6K65_41225 [Moorea sp. SIO3C2]|nr:hypothetical protein [Moorena sp. SIO3C2]
MLNAIAHQIPEKRGAIASAICNDMNGSYRYSFRYAGITPWLSAIAPFTSPEVIASSSHQSDRPSHFTK